MTPFAIVPVSPGIEIFTPLTLPVTDPAGATALMESPDWITLASPPLLIEYFPPQWTQIDPLSQ